jgi:hypothetical protein
MATKTVKEAVDFIFATLDESGVNVTDFHRLTGVSRVTLYNWKNTREASDMFRLGYAHQVAEKLHKAVEDKKLPFADRLQKGHRISELEKLTGIIARKP